VFFYQLAIEIDMSPELDGETFELEIKNGRHCY
jgi:hypothetical protein